jgi:gamma-tubulin complex component 3
MLKKWLLDGEIEDPHSEFFIEGMANVEVAGLWHDKYRLRESMLPKFISNKMAKKILLIGKSINFLKEVCQVKTTVRERDELKMHLERKSMDLFSPTADTPLHQLIDKIYVNTSKMLLDNVMGPHRLQEHLKAMKNYLLLGKGDFINVLMENMKDELDRPARDIYQHDLFSIMAASVRSTTAECEDPEVLEHLDVRLMYPYDGDSGWDIFTLRYTFKGELNG